MKVLQALNSHKGAFAAVVYWDGDWREYLVCLHVLGVKLAQCQYRTEHRSRAHEAARDMLESAPAYYPWALSAANASQAVAS